MLLIKKCFNYFINKVNNMYKLCIVDVQYIVRYN
ncbi:Uncharacterised protein [uncultured Clostridium sp.]|nr:Uncharacterised protein [uncultured Clostridium sp.]